MPVPSRTIVDMPRSGIREIMDLAAGRDDVVHLEVGQPDFRTPEHIQEAAIRAVRDGFHGYTPNKGIPSLREALVERSRADGGPSFDTEDVVVTTGAVNALYETLAVLTDPGDAVLVPDPGWPNYAMMASMLRIRSVGYPTPAEQGSAPDLNRLEELLRTTERAKALLLNSPNNPTGAVYPRATIERVVELCQRYDVYLLSDECYDKIVFDAEHVAPASIDDSGCVFTVRSVSKTYAMTGWRVGFLIAPTRELADLVAKAQEPVTSCATAISQKAAEAALLGDQGPADEMVRAYHRRRDVAVRVLGSGGAGVLSSRPNGAFYALVDLPDVGIDSAAFARSAVSEHGVAVAPGATFGPAGHAKVRISLAAAEAEVKEGADRLVAAIQAAARSR